MTVEQLIVELQKLPPEAIVVVDFDGVGTDAHTVVIDGAVSIRPNSDVVLSRKKFIALNAGPVVGYWRN